MPKRERDWQWPPKWYGSLSVMLTRERWMQLRSEPDARPKPYRVLDYWPHPEV